MQSLPEQTQPEEQPERAEKGWLQRWVEAKTASWRWRAALGAAAVMAVVVPAQNLDEVNRWRQWNQQGSMIPSVPGCPVFEAEEIEETTDTAPGGELQHPYHHTDVRSAAREVDHNGFNLAETTRQVLEFFDHPQSSFISEYSGVEFEFYSDQEQAEWRIDEAAFDEAFHIGLTADVDYEDPEVQHTVDCLQERIVTNREFAGEKYSIFIPSAVETCLANGRILHYDEHSWRECQQKGFTPPLLQFNLLFWQPVSERVMVLTSGRHATPESAGEDLTELLLHEAIHAELTLTDTPLRIDPDESWAQHRENAVVDKIIGELEPFITFYPQQQPQQSPEVLSITHN